MTATTWRASALLAACLAANSALAQVPAGAAEPEPPQARLQARAYGVGPIGPKQAGEYIQVQISLRGKSIRIDFLDDNAPDAWLVSEGRRGQAWLVSESGNYTLPVTDASGPYWYDPKAPCIVLGGRCSPAPGEFIVGRLAAGWRYEGAAQGPDGTTSGTLWIDTQTGLMLGYRGRTGRSRRERSLRVTDVVFEAVPEAEFEPPAGLRRPAAKPGD